MRQIEMTIDAGHSSLADKLMRGLSALACGLDRAGVVAAPAGHAVLAAHLLTDGMGELNSSLLPQGGVAVVMCLLSNDVLEPFGRMRIGLSEPICCRDVTIAAAWPDAGRIVAMSGPCELRFGCDMRHAVA